MKQVLAILLFVGVTFGLVAYVKREARICKAQNGFYFNGSCIGAK